MADDTYDSVATVAESGSLRRRVTACAAKEGQTDPEAWAYEQRWTWAAAPGWGSAFAYAEEHGNADPGADPAVVTDGQILTEIQRIRASSPTTTP